MSPEMVYRIHSPQLLNSARRQLPQSLRARIDPDDILQDTFAVYFADFSNTPDADIGRTLSGILRHTVLSAIEYHTSAKRNPAREFHADIISDTGEILSPVDTLPARAVPDTSLPDYLSRALSALPDDQRQAIQLSADGYNAREIAALLGTHTRRAARLIDRARRQLAA